MVTNGPIAELGRSLRSLQTVVFFFLRRGDESSVAAAGAAHRPKPPHLNHVICAWRRLGGKVTLKPPEGEESVINVSTRLLGDLL